MIERIPDLRDRLEKTGASVDQFGALRVSEPTIELNIQGRYGVLPLRETVRQIDGTALGGGAAVLDDAVTKITSGTVAGETLRLQSNRFINYSPGVYAEHSQMVWRDASPTGAQTWQWGAFNRDEGMYFEEDASGDISMHIRRDGTSRKLRDIDDALILERPDASLLDNGLVWVIGYSWYGAGSVIFGARKSESIDPYARGEVTKIFAVYDSTRDSTTAKPYTRTPNLPSSIAIENGGSTLSSELTIYSNERQIATGARRARDPRTLTQIFGPFDVGTTRESLLALRPKELFQGRINDVNTRIKRVEFDSGDSANDVDVYASIGATSTGTTWTDSRYSEPQSSVEIAAGTNIGTITTTNAIAVPPRELLRSARSTKIIPAATEDNETVLGEEQIFLIEGEATAAGTNEIYVKVVWEETH